MLKEKLNTIFRDFKSVLLFVAFISMFLNIFLLAPSIYMLQIYDRVVTSRSSETLFMITLILVVIFVFLFLLDWFRNKIMLRVSNKFDNMLKQDVFQGLFDTSLKDPSQSNTKALRDLGQIRQFVSSPALTAFFDIPWTIMYLAILFAFHIWYGAFALFTVVVLGIIIYFKEKTTKKKQEDIKNIQSKEHESTQSYIDNSEIIHAMGMQNQINSNYNEIYEKWLQIHTSTTDTSTTWTTLTKYLRMMFQSLMLGIGAYLAINMEITSGMIIAGSLILGRVLAPLDILTNQWKLVVLARKSYFDLKEFSTQLTDTKENMDLPIPTGKVNMVDIIVIPPKSKEAVLKHISLEFNSGKIISIIGESASGKSSLIRAMLGVWPVSHGKVMFDGADIHQWDRSKLGEFIGYLPQDIELFEGTVAQNIARMAKEPDSNAVINAAELCDAHELIVNLPDGYNTQIGKRGVALSGGQRQRIALARAVFGNPKIVVLDEPNSNLDDKGDLALVKTMQKVKSTGSTVILVTHKPNILRYTDEIVVLKSGSVASHLSTSEFFKKMGKGLENVK